MRRRERGLLAVVTLIVLGVVGCTRLPEGPTDDADGDTIATVATDTAASGPDTELPGTEPSDTDRSDTEPLVTDGPVTADDAGDSADPAVVTALGVVGAGLLVLLAVWWMLRVNRPEDELS